MTELNKGNLISIRRNIKRAEQYVESQPLKAKHEINAAHQKLESLRGE